MPKSAMLQNKIRNARHTVWTNLTWRRIARGPGAWYEICPSNSSANTHASMHTWDWFQPPIIPKPIEISPLRKVHELKNPPQQNIYTKIYFCIRAGMMVCNGRLRGSKEFGWPQLSSKLWQCQSGITNTKSMQTGKWTLGQQSQVSQCTPPNPANAPGASVLQWKS